MVPNLYGIVLTDVTAQLLPVDQNAKGIINTRYGGIIGYHSNKW